MLDKAKPEIKLPTMGDLIDQKVAEYKIFHAFFTYFS